MFSPRWILEPPHILKYLSFLVKFVFFKSDVSCTQIWLSPRFSPISCFCQYCNQIVPQTALQTLKIFKLGCNLKICLVGYLATSNLCIFTERDFRKTSYFERFEFFGEICIFQIWLILDPNLTFTTIFPNFWLLPELQPNRSPDPSSNTPIFQTRVKSQNLPRWVPCDIKPLCSHPGGFWNNLIFWNISVFWWNLYFSNLTYLAPKSDFHHDFSHFLL